MTTLTDDQLDDLLGQLDLETKLRLITGDGFWTTSAVPEIGLRRMILSDGPVGVRGAAFSEGAYSASFPCGTALAATWDEDILGQVGEALAAEAVRKDVDVVLGPTINLHRSPLAGRNFECYSEDPHLSGRLATAYVRGLQQHGVSACPKHFVANDAETDRTTVDNRIDERTLRELYLTPFEMVVEDAHPWTIMSSYNKVNGTSMSEHGLLADVLKDEWGWDGAVVCDWGGIYSTVPTARGANDLAMPGPEARWGAPLRDAIEAGEVDVAAIDAKVRNLLRLAARVGALEGATPSADRPPAADVGDAASLARAAACAGTVLLRNDGVLPLDPATVSSVALLGPNLGEFRHQGGGSAMVFTPEVATPLPSLRRAFGPDVRITTAVGAPRNDRLRFLNAHEVQDGHLTWLDDAGNVVLEQPCSTARAVRSLAATPAGATAIEIRGSFVPTSTGTWTIGVQGVGPFVLEIDGTTVLDVDHAMPDDETTSVLAFPQSGVAHACETGTPVGVTLRHSLLRHPPIYTASIVVGEPREAADEDELAHAVELARAADVAIVVVGTSDQDEAEGHDRSDLRLAGRQDELVAAVAAANPRTVVVVNAGAPVEMPWRDDVGAVLLPWFSGMEAGNALADVVVGAAEPGGRLPMTWPATTTDAPVLSTTPVGGTLPYDEGPFIGYRAYQHDGIAPAYWFGHGLGYTTWTYDAVDVTGTDVTVRVTNTGTRRGRTVVQAYTRRPDSTVERAELVLSGYGIVEADPAETVGVHIDLDPRTLRHWDVATDDWTTEAGRVDVHVGPHVGELPLVTSTSIPGDGS